MKKDLGRSKQTDFIVNTADESFWINVGVMPELSPTMIQVYSLTLAVDIHNIADSLSTS